MVNVRQKNLRAFIFTKSDDDKVIAYLRKNSILLSDFILIFSYEIGYSVLECLKELNLNFVQENNNQFHVAKESTNKEIQKREYSDILKTLVLHRNVRSGEEIVSDGDITIFGNVNSGAIVQSMGNIQIFGEINGNVFCNGNYIIAGAVKEGNLLLNGTIVDKENLIGDIKKIYRVDNDIKIERLQ